MKSILTPVTTNTSWSSGFNWRSIACTANADGAPFDRRVLIVITSEVLFNPIPLTSVSCYVKLYIGSRIYGKYGKNKPK